MNREQRKIFKGVLQTMSNAALRQFESGSTEVNEMVRAELRFRFWVVVAKI